MKFKIVCVLAIIIMVSCGKFRDDAKDMDDKVKDTVVAVNNSGSDEKDARGVIAYNNAMVDYLKDAGSKIKSASEDYLKMSNMVANKQKDRFFTGHAFIGSAPDINRKRDGISLLEPTINLPSEVQKELTHNLKSASVAFENTQEAYEKFKAYLHNEDYKDDNWAKGKEHLEVIKNNIMAFYDKSTECTQILKPFAEEAEVKLFKNHPLKESLSASKKDLTLAEEIVAIVHAEKIDMEALSIKYDKLEENYARHKDLTPELLKKFNKIIYYKNFYNKIDAFLGEVRKCKRDGKITNDEAEDIERKYQSLISLYNSIV